MSEPTFEQRIPEIDREIQKRRHKWVLSTIAWEDVTQTLMLHIFVKYDTFNPKRGKFQHWVNRVISHQWSNILRKNLYKHSRPCIQMGGCAYNLGEDACGFTASGKQCKECPIYARWHNRKINQFNIVQSLPLENHVQEANNIQSDFLDIETAKRIIDEKIKGKLKPFEYQVYEMLFIKNMTEEQVGAALNYKKSKNSNIAGYQTIKALKTKFVCLAKEIIQQDGLV